MLLQQYFPTVMNARKAVGDDAQNQSIIKTLHGHGYRFIAQMEDDEAAAPEFSNSAGVGLETTKPGKRPGLWKINSTWALVVLSLLVAISFLISSGFFDEEPEFERDPAEGVAIAVLPFTNLSDDKGSESPGHGLELFGGRENLSIFLQGHQQKFEDYCQ